MGPRLEPLPAEDWDDSVREALSPLLPLQRANPTDAGNVLGTLVRHPALTQAYLTFNAHLLVSSTLSARLREVALLRAVQVRRCDYLWEHHIPLAQRAGLTLAEIDGIRTGAPSDDVDALVVRAVDEMDSSNTLSDAMWTALGEHFDERQIMDLIFTVGCYQLLGTAVNAFGVESEHP